MSTPTTLRERLLYLEARVAMVEDWRDDLRARLRRWARTALAAAELLGLWVIIKFVEVNYPREK